MTSLLILFAATTLVFGQATQTGSIAGTVRSPDGIAVPGVTVTASSPALQGERVTYTTENGAFVLRGLPPGQYVVVFTMSGMTTVRQSVRVDLGMPARADATMSISPAAEAITVTAEAPIALNTTQLGTNLKGDTIDTLPVGRNLWQIAINTPGVNANTYNVGQVRISGAFAYDNVFLVDGTDVNDNLFGTAHNLFIEDAIEETQVLTGGVSAEYGRFTGGVINAITKSGGNEFDGTFRVDMTNPDWTDKTPYEEAQGIDRLDEISEVYSATLGGPILRDHLWFFLAGRNQETSAQASLAETGINITQTVENPRYEIKLTGTIANNHTIQGSWMDNETIQGNNIPLAGRTMDVRGLAVERTLPNDRWAAFYNGILSTNLFAEVKYSEKTFGFRNTGGTSTDIHDSPFLTRTGASRHYNAPYFDSNDPEDRNNQDLTVSLSYFYSPPKLGTHDIKAGVEQYISNRTGGNSQSSTSYVFNSDFARNPNGSPAVDASGRYVPRFIPYPQSGFSTVVNYIATRGANVDITTRSIFVNDRWDMNTHFSFNLGVRHEVVESDATGDIVTVDSSRTTPRLAAAWDIFGDGRRKVDLTYSQYSGKYNERQFAVNTNVGNPSSVSMRYIGPPGEGVGFEPGFDLDNYEIYTGSFPLQNVFVAGDLKSPVVDEWTLSFGTRIGSGGFAKATYSMREWGTFWDDFIGTSGSTEVVITPTIKRVFDNILYGNTDAMTREYEALQVLGQYKVTNAWTVHGSYTFEITNDGNFVGEAGNQPGNASLYGDYPGLYNPERHYPEGRLPGFQEHRLRLLNTYRLALGGLGNLDLGLIYGYDSPTTFSYTVGAVPITSIQQARLTAAGYKSPPTSQTIFFGERGIGEYEEQHALDVAATYGLPIFGTIEPWLKVEIFNITNQDALITFDTTLSTDPNSPKDADGLPTGYIKGARFGQATSAANYQRPTTYQVSAGIRF